MLMYVKCAVECRTSKPTSRAEDDVRPSDSVTVSISPGGAVALVLYQASSDFALIFAEYSGVARCECVENNTLRILGGRY